MKHKLSFLLIAIFTSTFLFSTNFTINTQGMTFVPSSITITAGDTVTFVNNGGFHNVNGTVQTFPSNPVSFSNPTGISSAWTYVHIFSTVGFYQYQCDPHIPAMVGSITVNSPPNSVYDIISNSVDHTTLNTAIDACGLDGTLSGPGPFTVFAPTDAAFNNLPAGTITSLLNDIPALTDILLHHVVGDSVMSGMLSNNQVVSTLLGTDVTVTITSSGDVYIDNAMVTLVDLVGDNGVVHVIDAVLIPTTTDIIDNINTVKEYLYTLNILGEKVNKNVKNQMLFNIFSDGSVVKLINR